MARCSALSLAPSSSSVKLQTLDGCRLGVSWYPDFSYNAGGGRGIGSAEKLANGRLGVEFDPSSIVIPPLNYSTARFLGVPLPPPLRIDIKPQLLRGFIDQSTGNVELEFVAEFFLTVGSLYRAPALLVNTLLTTEACKGKQRSAQGKRLDQDGQCKLVGTAELTPVNDLFLDTFLTLPSECLAEMSAKLQISEPK